MNRREFLLSTLAASVFACGASSNSTSTSTSKEPATIVTSSAPRRLIAVDMHNHVYPAGTEPLPERGPPREQQREAAPPLPLGAALEASGFTAVCSAFVLDFARNEKPGDARSNYLAWLDAIDAELARSGRRRALAWRDVEAAYDTKKPTIIQSVEGAHFIEGDLKRIAEVYERGLRHLQLLHDKDDLVTPLGDIVTGAAHLGGLTTFGAEVVIECNRRGIVVDLAHGNRETILTAAKISTHPIIVSHTNLDTWTGKNARMAQMMKPRFIDHDVAKAVADRGGVVGVWTKLVESMPEYVQSIKAMVDAIGADHVGLGTDNDLLSSDAGKATNHPWRDAPAVSGGFVPALTAEMKKQAFSDDDIAKIAGANYGRVFAKVTGS